ncbi:MAG: hypothetical protein JRD94_00360 [Deltaproteobacteria bacterium]|nr:hypothetical protein [Deltaproteobacteria bacterium]
MVAERRDCLEDDHCPCGTHCELGICEASCEADGDCADGNACDDFGRCRPSGQGALVPTPSATRSASDVQPLSPAVSLDPATGEGTLRLAAKSGAPAEVRVLAREGAEVQCPDNAWANECMLSDVAPGAELELPVRFAGDVPAGQESATGRISVFSTGGDNAIVSLIRPAIAASQKALAEPSLEGFYEGVASILTAGLEGDEALDPAPVGPVQVPIAATIYGDSSGATIVFDDPRGAFSSNLELIGSFGALTDLGEGLYEATADFPVQPYLEGDLGAGSDYEVLSDIVTATLRVRDFPRLVELTVLQRFVGLGPNTQPTVIWRVSLGRTGEAQGTAPAVPADATLSVNPSVIETTPTPWEARVYEALSYQGGYWPYVWRDAQWAACDAPGKHSSSLSPQTLTRDRAFADALGLIGANLGYDYTTGATPPDWKSPLLAALGTALVPVSCSNCPNPQIFDVHSTGFQSLSVASPEDLPCAGTMSGVLIAQDGATSFSASFDTCFDLARRTGCEMISLPSEIILPFSTPWSGRFNTTTAGSGSRIDGQATWTRSCTMPETPAYCAFYAACVEPNAGLNSRSVPTSLLRSFSSAAPLSGDVSCASGSRNAAIPLDALSDADQATARIALEGCLADIDRLRGTPPAHPVVDMVGRPLTSNAENLLGDLGNPSTAVLDQGQCLDPARLLISIRQGLETARSQTFPVLSAAPAGPFALGLMSRWLALHGFFASEAVEQSSFVAASLRGTGDEPVDPPVRLAQSLGAWDLVFHPRFADSLGRLGGVTLLHADYRIPLGTTTNGAEAQSAGLPMAIFDTVARQMNLVAVILEQGLRGSDPAAVEALALALPRAVVAGALARGLHARASAAAAARQVPLAWEERYAAAEARAVSAMNTAERQAGRLEAGANPLGIEDSDLPLYFTAEGTAASGDLGPGGRYAAVSDFLLGTGPGSSAWAPSLVNQAGGALMLARDAFIDQGDREFRTQATAVRQQTWIDRVRREYNQTLFDYCGPINDPSPIDNPDFRAASCPIDFSNPECRTDATPWYARWTEADLLGRVCVARKITTADETGLSDERTRNFVDACYVGETPTDSTRGWDILRIDECPNAADGMCLACVSNSGLGSLPLGNHSFQLQPTLISGTGRYNQGEVASGKLLADARRACLPYYPSMREEVPRPDSAIEKPECLNADLGDAYLDVVTASRSLESSRAAYAELQDSYDIAVRSCTILADTAQEAEQARQAHERNMTGLIVARGAADSAATAAGAVKDCLGALASGSASTPWDAIKSGLAVAGSCVAGGVEAAANIASIALGAEVENAQRRHEDAVTELQEGSEIRVCYNDALSELVGMRRASLDIEQAAFDLGRASGTLSALIAEVQRFWFEGHNYLVEIEASTTPPPAGDIWVDEYVGTYARRFRLARRTVYLALRAVEFEQQQSLALRSEVFEAGTPDELEAVLQDLWSTAGTRTVNGSRPSDLQIVLSLRDDILRVGDESGLPESARPLSAIQRFRLRLADPQYAIYDEADEWQGQQIPFDLLPLGALGFDFSGVPIYAQTDCAERLWSVNASVLGTDLIAGSDTTMVRMDLLKSNTFSSQWCTTPPEGEPFQTASTRPTRNLFREPGEGGEPGIGFGTKDEVDTFTRGRMQAFLGVDRATLEDPTYANGETSELAARGLFGEYALFIPAAVIAREGEDGSYSNGIVLDRIDDILLRLDYVSVAR